MQSPEAGVNLLHQLKLQESWDNLQLRCTLVLVMNSESYCNTNAQLALSIVNLLLQTFSHFTCSKYILF